MKVNACLLDSECYKRGLIKGLSRASLYEILLSACKFMFAALFKLAFDDG